MSISMERTCRLIALGLMANPSLMIEACRGFLSMAYLPGLRGEAGALRWLTGNGHPDRPRRFAGATSADYDSRPSSAADLTLHVLSHELLEDLRRELPTRILRDYFNNDVAAASLCPHLSLYHLLEVTLGAGAQEKIVAFFRDNNVPDYRCVDWTIATMVLEMLRPKGIDFRLYLFPERIAEKNDRQCRLWIGWWGHSFMNIPEWVLKGNALAAEALELMRQAPLQQLFLRHMDQPHADSQSPYFFDNVVHSEIFQRVYAECSVAWVLSLLMEIARAIVTAPSEEAFRVFRRCFTDALAVWHCSEYRDMDFLLRDRLVFNDSALIGHPFSLVYSGDARAFLGQWPAAAAAAATGVTPSWEIIQQRAWRDVIVPSLRECLRRLIIETLVPQLYFGANVSADSNNTPDTNAATTTAVTDAMEED